MASSVVTASRPAPVRPRIPARLAYRAHTVLARNRGYQRLAAWLERHPHLYRWFTAGERVSKQLLFGCRMCGQCALPATGYACPMTCPKQLRNGPCGGVSPAGRCEVDPDLTCVWVIAAARATAGGHDGDLDLLQRPVDNRQWERSSWLNYWQGRDEQLWVFVDEDDPHPAMLTGRSDAADGTRALEGSPPRTVAP